MNRGMKIGAGIVVIVAALIYWTMSSLSGNEVYYVTVQDLQQSDFIGETQRVKLGGIVQTGSINLLDPMNVDFRIEQDSAYVPVNYKGIIPDMFKDDAEVIVEGHYVNSVFVADNLIAKCASKYETNFEHNGAAMDSTKQVEV